MIGTQALTSAIIHGISGKEVMGSKVRIISSTISGLSSVNSTGEVSSSVEVLDLTLKGFSVSSRVKP